MSSPDTSTLKTKLEEDFVSPLTAVRGVLEILRDFPDLEPRQRRRFVESALAECSRLERGIDELAGAVYAAARQASDSPAESPAGTTARRIAFLQDEEIAELDLSGIVFKSTAMVNAFFDDVERLVRATGQRWYFLVDHTDCRVWPEAWVAFAHRGKKLDVGFALRTVRFEQTGAGDAATGAGPNASDLYPSRAAAHAEIERLTKAAG